MRFVGKLLVSLFIWIGLAIASMLLPIPEFVPLSFALDVLTAFAFVVAPAVSLVIGFGLAQHQAIAVRQTGISRT